MFRFGMRLVLALLLAATQAASGAVVVTCCEADVPDSLASNRADTIEHAEHSPAVLTTALHMGGGQPVEDAHPCPPACSPDGCPVGGCIGFVTNGPLQLAHEPLVGDVEFRWAARPLPLEALSPLYRPPIAA